MLRNVRNLTEQGGHAGSGIRSSPSCNKRMLYRPYEVLMRPCLMRRECLATAARIHSVSAQSNKIPRDEEGRLGGESSLGGTTFKRSQISWKWTLSSEKDGNSSTQEWSPNWVAQANSWSTAQGASLTLVMSILENRYAVFRGEKKREKNEGN